MFMDAFMVQLVQFVFIVCIWIYAWQTSTFMITPAATIDMIIARFLGSLMMHINVEKEIRAGLTMMKYAVNHHENFTNVYPAFVIAWSSVIINLTVEANVMIILSTLPNVMSVIMKYVSLAAIANIPKFYYASLLEHKMLKCCKENIKITNFRHNNPLAKAPLIIKLFRVIQKSLRTLFACISFYFNPFLAIFLNFTFMISYETQYFFATHPKS